jgi:hypothetical protein
VSLTQKELESLESQLNDAISEKVSSKVESLMTTCGKLERSKSQFTGEILVEKDLQEEKSKYSQQQKLKAELSKTEKS